MTVIVHRNLFLWLGLAFNSGAFRILKKGQSDLSAERWWHKSTGGSETTKPHFAKRSDVDLKLCADVPGFKSQCPPLANMWGACYNNDLDDWRCIRTDDPDIKGYREGLCKNSSTAADSKVKYDDVCLVAYAETIIYKCPGIPTYEEGVPDFSCWKATRTQLQWKTNESSQDIAFACFSLRKGVTWQCISSDESVPRCITTQLPSIEQVVKGESYDGVCVHDSSPLHKYAKSGSKLIIRATSTAKTTSSRTMTNTIIVERKNTAETGESNDKDDDLVLVTTTTPIPVEATTSMRTAPTTSIKSGTIKSQFNRLAMAAIFCYCVPI